MTLRRECGVLILHYLDNHWMKSVKCILYVMCEVVQACLPLAQLSAASGLRAKLWHVGRLQVAHSRD